MNAPAAAREGISSFHGLDLWRQVEETDVRFTKSFDRGQFKGNAVDAIYNVMRLTERLGPVGAGWGWRVKSDRLDTFGTGEDQQVIHTVVLEVWFRQSDGSKEFVEHMGHTKVSYWTRARRPGEKPRFVVDDEFGKKSITDALSKVMVNLGASADIWLGRFDGNKYVAPDREGEEKPARTARPAAPAPDQGDSDGDRLARASRPAALPPDRDSTPTFMLSGDPVSAEDWVKNAVAIAKELTPSKLTIWWEEHKDERAKMRRRRPDMNETLDKLKAKVLAKCGTFNGTGHVSALDALRAG